MTRKLNKRRALRQMAKDAPDRKYWDVWLPRLMQESDQYSIWNEKIEPWTRLIEIKYGRPMQINVETLMIGPNGIRVIAEVKHG